MRILCFSYGHEGCWWIRLKMPLEQLAKKHTVMLTDGKTKYPLDAFQIVVLNNIIVKPEVVVNGKAYLTSIQEMIVDFKRRGIKVVYDTDDSQEIHPLHGYMGKVVDENIDSYFYILQHADLITTTTPHLKKHLSQFTNKPIMVLPNCINPELFKQRGKEDKIKIGFAGSFSHIPDLDIVMPSIYKLKKKYDLYFETLGFQKDNCKFKKPVRVDKYYDALASLNADIGICPLLENAFNQNKSPLKFLEYTMVGTMVLASNRPPYKGELKPEWLVDDDKWEETLERFILDKELRERTAREQKEWVLENRDIRKKFIMWEEAYRKALNIPNQELRIWNGTYVIKPLNENAGKLLEEVANKFVENEVKNWWISAGTALCIYRDGDFSKSDTDLDFAMLGYEGCVEDMKKIIGGEVIRTVYDELNRPMQIALLKDENIVDIYFHYKNGKDIENHNQSGWTRMDADICLIPKIIETKYGPLPFPQDEYYEIRYGKDWRTPSNSKAIFYEI